MSWSDVSGAPHQPPGSIYRLHATPSLMDDDAGFCWREASRVWQMIISGGVKAVIYRRA